MLLGKILTGFRWVMIIALVLGTCGGSLVGTLYFKNVITQRDRLTQKVKNLETELMGLEKLQEREERIKTMEQTLIVHYKLSWHEAHYYSVIIDDFSQKYDIPWQVYPAVIRIESNFDPTLLSSKGARGMTQVLESTGKPIAEELGIKWTPQKTLWSEIPNMVIGFTYLSRAIKESGLEDGIRTYIGGPGFDKGCKLVGSYRTTVRWEFDRLKYIHKGVMSSETPEQSMVLAEAENLTDE